MTDQHPNRPTVSLFNHVLGPIMLGPSSSHTAGPHRLSGLAADLLGEPLKSARFTFDPSGSFARVYRQQGSDLGFASGLLGWDLTDRRLDSALTEAAAQGLEIEFVIEPLPRNDHPNLVRIDLTGQGGRRLAARAKSMGGGAVALTEVDGFEVEISGGRHETLIAIDSDALAGALDLVRSWGFEPTVTEDDGGLALIQFGDVAPLDQDRRAELEALPGLERLYTARPVLFVQPGRPPFESAGEMVAWAEARNLSLGQAGLAYEAAVLGLEPSEVEAEMGRRLRVMTDAVAAGLDPRVKPPRLVKPAAAGIMAAEAEGRLALGGPTTRAAARAMGVMHVNSTTGLVCAAPTGGSSGVIPGVIDTLEREMGLDEAGLIRCLLAASAVGLIVALRSTFAAEVAGCQVEIGVSSAMAAAAVVEYAGGTAAQAADAAAIAIQNNMGSVCDPVAGMVEIPCHTRNAVGAASAFVCADLILGGYHNPVPLDETIDAMDAVGRALPMELKCTALGGLAMAPSACRLAEEMNKG